MKGRIVYVSAMLGMLALAACAPPTPPTTGTPADETAIRAIGPAYADAWNKADVATLTGFSTDDYEAVQPDGKVIKGKAAVEEEAKTSAAARAGLPLKLAVQTTILRWTSASTAAIGGTWTMEGVPAGMGADKGAWSGTVTKSADGKWRMVTGLVAEFVPPPPPPPAPKDAKAKGKGK
jgi:ketosteroid isomerase-like protein